MYSSENYKDSNQRGLATIEQNNNLSDSILYLNDKNDVAQITSNKLEHDDAAHTLYVQQ